MSANTTGRWASAILDVISHPAQVQRVEVVGERFRVVTFGSAGLRGRTWTPGDMLQIVVGGSALGLWEHRSYTPFAFSSAAGTTDVLAYLHGGGAGAAWFAAARPGLHCHFVGPRSVFAPTANKPVVFFGDETSISTAAAFAATPSGFHGIKFLFEVGSVEDAGAALERFGITDGVRLVAREEGDVHLATLERALISAFASETAARGIFTGKASSIQRLYRSVRAAGVPRRQITNVAYWASGRKGFSGIQR